MAEFTSLNGYQVKDTVARSIAKGRNQAVAFVDYETMIETLNGLEKDEYRAGQNIYIGVVGVPDLWVYSIENIVHNFEYVSDEDMVEMLKNNTTIQVGYYKLAMLEGQKVDLTTYDQKLLEHDQKLEQHDESIAELSENVEGISESLGKDGEVGEDSMTVHEKLDYLMHSRGYGGVSEGEVLKSGVISKIENNTIPITRTMGDTVCFFVPNKDIRTIKTNQGSLRIYIYAMLEDGSIRTAQNTSNTTITASMPIKFALVSMYGDLNFDGYEVKILLS